MEAHASRRPESRFVDNVGRPIRPPGCQAEWLRPRHLRTDGFRAQRGFHRAPPIRLGWDWDRDLGRALDACRNVPGNGLNRAVFLPKGGESSGYPFSNHRLLSENPLSEIFPLSRLFSDGSRPGNLQQLRSNPRGVNL
jgi:hypothetical protein